MDEQQQPQETPPPVAVASATPQKMISVDALHRIALERVAKSGANWLYWIVGLTLLNMILVRANSNTTFLIGLGLPQVIDGIAYAFVSKGAEDVVIIEGAKGAMAVAFIINLIGLGVYAALGWAAGSKRQVWAYTLGMVLFALDSLIFIIAQHWFGIIFHGLVLYWMWPGLKALKALNAHENAPAPVSVVPPSVAQAIPVAPPPYQPAAEVETAVDAADEEPKRETLA